MVDPVVDADSTGPRRSLGHVCPDCGARVETFSNGKLIPHQDGVARCPGAGKKIGRSAARVRTSQKDILFGSMSLAVLLSIAAALVVAVVFVGAAAVRGGDSLWTWFNEDDAEWCQEMREFYRDNPYDSNRNLEREFTLRC